MVAGDVRSPGRRDVALERRWRERVARWEASGLSVRAFCRQRGLTEPTFHYWKRELRSRDQATSTAAAKSSAQRTAAAVPRAAFVPLTVLSSATLSVEVRCPSGHVVCLPACAVSVLASLFAALNSPANAEPSC